MKRFNSILCVVDPEESPDTVIVQSMKIANDHQADITFASLIGTATLWHTALRHKVDYSKYINELAENKKSALKNIISTVAPFFEGENRVLLWPGVYKNYTKRDKQSVRSGCEVCQE